MDTLRPTRNDRYMTQKYSKRAGVFSSQPPEISLFFWQFFPIFHSNILGIVWFLIDRSSLLRKVPDRQLMSESINFNSISNMIYGISSMIYGIGASIDISVRSVLRESRPGFPARGHDSESKRPLFGCICNACSNNTL